MAAEFVKTGSNWKLSASHAKYKPGLGGRGMFRTLSIVHTTGKTREFLTCHVMEDAVTSITDLRLRGGEVVTEMIRSFIEFQSLWVENLGVRCDDSFGGIWESFGFRLRWCWIQQHSLEEYYRQVGARSHWTFERHGSSLTNAIWIDGHKDFGKSVEGLVPIESFVSARGQLLEDTIKEGSPDAYAWKSTPHFISRWKFHPSMTPEMQIAIQRTKWEVGEFPTV